MLEKLKFFALGLTIMLFTVALLPLVIFYAVYLIGYCGYEEYQDFMGR